MIYGPLVKRLRHRPFTAITGVRFSQGSPFCGLVVQLVRMPACHAGGREFESHPSRHLFFMCAVVAQLAEQLICNQQVDGSSPPDSSIFLSYYISNLIFWGVARVAKGGGL